MRFATSPRSRPVPEPGEGAPRPRRRARASPGRSRLAAPRGLVNVGGHTCLIVDFATRRLRVVDSSPRRTGDQDDARRKRVGERHRPHCIWPTGEARGRVHLDAKGQCLASRRPTWRSQNRQLPLQVTQPRDRQAMPGSFVGEVLADDPQVAERVPHTTFPFSVGAVLDGDDHRSAIGHHGGAYCR